MAIIRPPILPTWADTGDKVQPSDLELAAGWPVTSIPPARERFNWFFNFCANAIRYFARRGLSDWVDTENYKIGDIQRSLVDGKTYRAILDHIGFEPSANPLKWERWGFSLNELNLFTSSFTPTIQRSFTGGIVLSDMPAMGVEATLQSIVFTGARGVRITAHASFKNENTTTSVNLTERLLLNGADSFGGHYLGVSLPAMNVGGTNVTQIPVTITDSVYGLNPATSYTLTLRASRQSNVGPLKVLDTYIGIEFI